MITESETSKLAPWQTPQAFWLLLALPMFILLFLYLGRVANSDAPGAWLMTAAGAYLLVVTPVAWVWNRYLNRGTKTPELFFVFLALLALSVVGRGHMATVFAREVAGLLTLLAIGGITLTLFRARR